MQLPLSEQTIAFIEHNLNADVCRLALGKHPEGVDLPTALTQIEGRRTAALKVPQWTGIPGIVYPGRVALEQCTNQQVAEYKRIYIQSILKKDGYATADLTGGWGVDCIWLSDRNGSTWYNDADAELCRIASHNFRLLGREDIRISHADAETCLNQLPKDGVDLIYVDPARRDDLGRKMVSMADCRPDILQMQDLLTARSRYVAVKLSPMLDLSVLLKELRSVAEVCIISLDGECKEVLAVLQAGFTGEAVIRAVNIDRENGPGMVLHATRTQDAALPSEMAGPDDLQPGVILFEPYAAPMKSGLFRTLQAVCHVKQLSRHAHLFLADHDRPGFPGRRFTVTAVMPFHDPSVKAYFRRIGRAHITSRHFPLSAEALRIRYHVGDGGPYYIFATTNARGERILIESVKV